MSKTNPETDEEIRGILQESRRRMTYLVDSLREHPDIQPAIVRLQDQDDMLLTFSGLAIENPDTMRLLLQAALAALTNVMAVSATDKEMQWRAAAGN